MRYDILKSLNGIYHGKSEDGSDMQRCEGMYTSPCGNYWSSEPFPDDYKPLTRRERRALARKLSKDSYG